MWVNRPSVHYRFDSEASFLYFRSAIKEWDDADDAEGTIYEAPTEGNSTDGASNQSQRNDEHAGNHPELDHPNIFDRIAERTNEGNRQDEVREGEPVGAVGEEGDIGRWWRRVRRAR